MRPVAVPESLRHLAVTPSGAAWLAELPSLVRRAAGRWSLVDAAPPYAGSHVSWVAAVRLRTGADAVLKVQYPHRESEHEAAALRVWDGAGAVRLLAADDDDHALLVERCLPGEHVSTRASAEALDVIAGLLPRLWRPASHPFRTLREEAGDWVRELPRAWDRAHRPFPVVLLDHACELLQSLAASQPEAVLLHQDLHADNVLSAGREPWLVIDPKPLVGERAFGLAPAIRAFELGHSRAAVVHRLDLLSERTGVDRERARGWALGQALAWAFDGDLLHARHLETARWLADA